ncbi:MULTISPECIES: cytochrome c oxidase assembly protein [unclassified Microbacterium]|uniref:cytochrome c oxidase assembly protein n=1 Tax=unclassified Microbacterium TaxID=2609290 RepID=UPI000EAA59FD|nr:MULTISPECIES: cytochrome c oxidase assembly protein [unclassified Microbacterium]MBT2484192.1 cytochrome c oxidase assembly protein [Microbacterium sp. ISL-108]RKN67128.1 cytochrome c oxidase assembly protein [Microbacterium sp. CGR2]
MHDHSPGGGSPFGQWIMLLPFVAAAIVYVAAAVGEQRIGRPWPWWRMTFWLLGLATAAIALSGTLASADRPFTAHIVGHLLIGMVAPLFLVLAAPVTLALRSFAVLPARRLSRALRSWPVRVLMHPVVAALLNVGGLWVLHLTPLYQNTSESFLHILLMAHFLLTGVLFTASILAVDPSPHRASVAVRLVVLALSLAAHGILAKTLYAAAVGAPGALAGLVHAPDVSPADLQTGAQIMFYGGDLVDLTLIGLLLWGWYRSPARRRATQDGRMPRRRPSALQRGMP